VNGRPTLYYDAVATRQTEDQAYVFEADSTAVNIVVIFLGFEVFWV